MTLPLIYIAGPFTAQTTWDIAENVRDAERWGLMVAKLGAMPLIPHANTSLFYGYQNDQFWYDGTLELLRKCDGIVVFDDTHHRGPSAGRKSTGVLNEIAEASKMGIPMWAHPGMPTTTGCLDSWLQAHFGDRLYPAML